jgi:hypothetical protein
MLLEWGSGHIILLTLQLKRLNFISNMALKGHFWGEKYPFKERKAHPVGESKTTLPSRSRMAKAT